MPNLELDWCSDAKLGDIHVERHLPSCIEDFPHNRPSVPQQWSFKPREKTVTGPFDKPTASSLNENYRQEQETLEEFFQCLS